MKIRGEWAFITGAAGGLGLAMANELAARGAKLILTDLAVASMQDAAEALRAGGTEVVVWAQDVTDRERWVEIADTLKAVGRIPRLLINNAGIAAAGPAVEISDESWSKVIDVDLWGVIHGCKTFVPHMLAGDGPHAVLNVASCAAFFGLPMGAPYCVAKAGVLSLTQSLQSEIDPARVHFTCLCPGAVMTGIWSSASDLGANQLDVLGRLARYVSPSKRTPEQVARRAIDGVFSRRALVTVYTEAWLLDLGRRLVPHQLRSRLSRRFRKWMFPEFV